MTFSCDKCKSVTPYSSCRKFEFLNLEIKLCMNCARLLVDLLKGWIAL